MKAVAVDTNLLVRLATADDPAEYRQVCDSLERRPWRVYLTVLLETEWVLRSVYGYSSTQFARFVDWLSGNPRIEMPDADLAREAAEHHRRGLDFADAVHVAQTRGEIFLSLDKKLRRRASKLGLKVEVP